MAIQQEGMDDNTSVFKQVTNVAKSIVRNSKSRGKFLLVQSNTIHKEDNKSSIKLWNNFKKKKIYKARINNISEEKWIEHHKELWYDPRENMKNEK
jgi:hypothetical protein